MFFDSLKIHLTILSCLLFFVSCTSHKKPAITVEAYQKQGVELMTISNRLVGEVNVKKLNSVAKALQISRTVSCVSEDNICDDFGKHLSTIIRASNDGVLSESEILELKQQNKNLKSSILSGEKELKELWRNYNSASK